MSPVAPSPDAFERFGELLRYLRRRAGLSQRELAIAVGYSESQISRIEQGQRPPDTAVLRARFMPALGLDDEPDLAERLLALAAAVPTTTLADSPPTPEIALIGQIGLIATKLFCPHAHPHLVPRPQLLATLDAALVTPLTLVAAPAGFGKTTLLASWLAQVERRAHGTPELPNHPDATSSSPPARSRPCPWHACALAGSSPSSAPPTCASQRRRPSCSCAR